MTSYPCRCLMLVMVVLTGCAIAPAEDREVHGIDVPNPTVVISSESAQLELVVDMTLDSEGNLLLLDWNRAAVVVVPADGGEPKILGRKGQGPGEFLYPSNVGVSPGRIKVLDQVSGRVHLIDYEGKLVGGFDLAAAISKADLGSEHAAYSRATTRPGEQLLTVTDAAGVVLHSVVEPVVPPATSWDMAAMRQVILRGDVPDEMRNNVLPVVRSDGGLWAFVQTERVLERYDASGAKVMERTIGLPENDSIVANFQKAAERFKNQLVLPLQFVNHAQAISEEVWLLWAVGTETVVTIHGPDGRLRQRINFEQVPAASHLAVDTERSRIYFHVGFDSSVVVFDLPEGLVGGPARSW